MKNIIRFFLIINSLLAIFIVKTLKQKTSKNIDGEEKILICNPVQTLGDTVISSAFINTVTKIFPVGTVDLIASVGLKNYYEDNRILGNIYYGPTWIRKKRVFIYRIPYAFYFIKIIMQKRNYKYIFIPRVDSDPLSIFICYLLPHKTIIRFSSSSGDWKKKYIEYDFDRLSQINIQMDERGIHESEAHNMLLKAINISTEIERPLHWIKYRKKVSLNKNIIIAIGSNSNRRRMSESRIIKLISKCVESFDVLVKVIGGKEDQVLLKKLEVKFGASILTNYKKYELSQYIEYVGENSIVVGYDSGITHLLSIDSLAVIVLTPHPKCGSSTHPNSPVRFSPINDKCRIIANTEICKNKCKNFCIANNTDCMDRLNDELIIKSIKQFI